MFADLLACSRYITDYNDDTPFLSRDKRYLHPVAPWVILSRFRCVSVRLSGRLNISVNLVGSNRLTFSSLN